MDAEYIAAFAEIKALIAALAVEIQGLKGGSGGNAGPIPTGHGTAHAPPQVFHGFDTADADWSQWTDLVGDKRYFNKDYWFYGLPGAQKGVELGLWGAGNTMMALMGGNEKTRHFKIITLMNPQPEGGHWLLAVKSAGDIGWIDASQFVVDMAASNAAEAAWEAAGCPSQDAQGRLIDAGKYVLDQHGNPMTQADVQGQFKVGP